MKALLKPLQWIYCIYALVIFVAIMLLIFPFVLFASFFGRIKGGNMTIRLCMIWADLWFLLIFIWQKRIYEAPHDKKRSYIFVSNHISYLDGRLNILNSSGGEQLELRKLGDDLCRDVLVGGVNDLGGTLMEETISRMAGSENGSFKTISQLADMVAPIGRQLRQRTTTYGQPSAERLAAASASDGVCASVRGLPGRPLPLISLPSAGF